MRLLRALAICCIAVGLLCIAIPIAFPPSPQLITGGTWCTTQTHLEPDYTGSLQIIGLAMIISGSVLFIYTLADNENGECNAQNKKRCPCCGKELL